LPPALQSGSRQVFQPNARSLFGPDRDAFRLRLEQGLEMWAQSTVDAGGAVSVDALLEAWRVQARLIFDDSVGIFESLLVGDNPFVTNWPLLPFSRGFVHAVSADAFDSPRVNPRYMALLPDIEMFTMGLRRLRDVSLQYLQTPPWPLNLTTNDDLRDFIMSHFTVNNHVLGSCMMAREDLGGVVDSRFRVHGVAGLRVVDPPCCRCSSPRT